MEEDLAEVDAVRAGEVHLPGDDVVLDRVADEPDLPRRLGELLLRVVVEQPVDAVGEERAAHRRGEGRPEPLEQPPGAVADGSLQQVEVAR